VYKILIKNSQPFGKKFQKNRRGDFFDSLYIRSHLGDVRSKGDVGGIT